MTFEGMDPQKVLAAAKVLRLEQENLDHISTSVNRIALGTRAFWHGVDGERFRTDARQAQARCKTASLHLGKLAQHAVDNAVAQLATSNQYGAVGAGGTGVSTTNLQGALNTAKALWNGTSVSADGSFHLGPDVKVSGDGSVLGIPVSGSAHAWAGVQGSGHAGASASIHHGLNADASGSIAAGAGADAHGSIGNKWFHVDDDATVFAGAQASGSAAAHLGLDGAGVDAKGSAMAGADATNHTFIGNRYVNSTTDLEGFAGARADANAGAHVDWTGADASAGVDAFAGAKATAGQTVDVGGLKGNGSISAEAGAGFEAKADAAVGWHDVGGDVDLGAALGPGLDVKVGVHLDPSETLHDAGSLASDGWHAVDSAAPWNW